MMAAALDAIRTCTRELLDQAQSRADEETLSKLVTAREEQIRRLTDVVAGPVSVPRAELQELLSLDAAVTEALQSRRDELWHELAALRQGRCAESAYRHDAQGPSRFLDREG